MAENKKTIDWGRIEADYRAGIKPLRLIAEENGITHGAVNKRAKRDGWTRDLKAKIVAVAEAKVSKAAVSAVVSAAKLVTEQQVVEANAELQYQVRMEHRSDIKRTRQLFLSLLEEIEVATDHEGRSLIETLAEIVNGPQDEETEESEQESKRRAERMRKQLNQLLDGAGRVDSAKKLTEMLEKLVKLERQAFGIEDDDKGANDIDKLLSRVHGLIA